MPQFVLITIELNGGKQFYCSFMLLLLFLDKLPPILVHIFLNLKRDTELCRLHMVSLVYSQSCSWTEAQVFCEASEASILKSALDGNWLHLSQRAHI